MLRFYGQIRQLNGVMSSPVSLSNHSFNGQTYSSKRLTSIVHILSPETANCPSWISGREWPCAENITWSIRQSSRKNAVDPAGVYPAISWPRVRRTSNWASKTGAPSVNNPKSYSAGKCKLRLDTNNKEHSARRERSELYGREYDQRKVTYIDIYIQQ